MLEQIKPERQQIADIIWQVINEKLPTLLREVRNMLPDTPGPERAT